MLTMETKMLEMLKEMRLDWHVVQDGVKTITEGIEIPNRAVLYREDTHDFLGFLSKNYVPYQNDELLELLFKIARQTGLQIHSGGFFGKGERVWIQLKSQDLVLPGDRLKGFISGLNSFDGSRLLAFGNAFTTVSCQNTWAKAYLEVETRLRHTQTLRPKIEEIIAKIDVLLNEEKETFADVRRLLDFRMDDATQMMVIDHLFNLKDQEKIEEVPIATLRRVETFLTDLKTETDQKGANLWGLFSGVTRYTTHSMMKGDSTEEKMFGRTGRIEQKIYSNLIELVH